MGRRTRVRESARSLYADTLGPLLRLVQDGIGSKLVPMIGADQKSYAEFDITAKLAGSFEGQASVLSTSTGGPWMTRNEARARQNLPAVEGGDEDVNSELESLRARFGSLKSVERAAETGDFVTIDLKAVIDDEEVDSVSGVSYEIGKGNMLEGLDDALSGLKTDESATFTTTLAGGEHKGEEAEVTVTATAVKERELPEADDDFAQEASEFDTMDELREDLRKQVADRKAADQAIAARDALLEHLREQVSFDVPTDVVEDEIKQHLSAEGKADDDDHAAEIRDDVTASVRDQILLDALAESLEVGVGQDELIDYLVQTAQQYGMEPAQFMQGAQKAGQIPAFVSEIARNKSLAMALRQVTVKDSDGQVVDLTEFIGSDELDAAAVVSEAEEAVSPADAGSEGSASSPSASSASAETAE